MKKIDILHYGEILQENITSRGLEKKKIYNDLLKMNPGTFDKRLKDGLFTQAQLIKLQKKGYL